MSAEEYSIRYYEAANGKRPFREWLCSLDDKNAIDRANARLARVRLGNFGDSRSLGSGMWELRIDYGPGYRVYFTRTGRSVVLLLCAGEKATQQKDIRRAREYLADYKRRQDAGKRII